MARLFISRNANLEEKHIGTHKSDSASSAAAILEIGWREWIALPDLGIPAIKAKVDTGARTSSLHAFELETFSEHGQCMVRFGFHPLQRKTQPEIYCIAPVVDERVVSDSGGHRESRLVIMTTLLLGAESWPIEITLANREDMLFRMLLGRTGLPENVRVNPSKSYLLGRKLARIYKKMLKQNQV